MKKQWLSMILVLCMVLCLAPTTARAEESKTCKVIITVEVNGLPTSVSAAGTTFTFQIKKAINAVTPRYYVYDTTTVNVGADGKGTSTVPVEEGKYIVKQDVPGDPIGEYVWYSISYTGGSNESGPQDVYGNGKSTEFKVYNTYKPASETNVTTLPITVTGYKAGANVKDARVTTTEPGIKLTYFRFMEMNPAGAWTPASLNETFKENTDYKVEVYFNEIPECNYTGLTGDSVTVNGVKADAFETTWDDSPKNEDYRVVHGLGKPEVVKKVKRIEITTPPTKTEYKAGEDFDPTGMEVTAVYENDSTAVLPETGYTIFHGENLQRERTYVTIQYNDGSGSSDVKVNLPITVNPYKGNHEHTYGNSWYSDDTSHWHQCTAEKCPALSDSTKDLASHTFVWRVDKAATATETGLKHEECTVCGFERNETEIPTRHGGRPDTKPDGGAENTATSPKTGDAGIALYAGLSLLALSGSGWVVGKKRRGEK